MVGAAQWIHWLLAFFAYSFFGWCCECAYCLFVQGQFVNRGFLNGPVCPVYGFGALSVIWMLTPLSHDTVLLFIAGTIVTSVLEYATGWLLETLFHTKWWDYSQFKYNLHGRVWLGNSVLFGVLAVLTVRMLHPFLWHVIGALHPVALIWIASACTTLFAVDLFLSVLTTLQLTGKLEKIHAAVTFIKERTEAAIAQGHSQLATLQSMPLAQRMEALFGKSEEGLRLRARFSELTHSHTRLQRRLLDAFPNMRSLRYPISLEELKKDIANTRAMQKLKRKKSSAPDKPAGQ